MGPRPSVIDDLVPSTELSTAPTPPESATGPTAGTLDQDPDDADGGNTLARSNGGDDANGRDPAEFDDEGGERPHRRISRAVVEWTALILAAVVIAIVIKTFLVQAFYIPSPSMVPTLDVGDRVLVNKLSYDFHDVQRGDIVVFAAGPNKQWNGLGHDDLVKRVVALPGETITQCDTNQVCIDGTVLREPYTMNSRRFTGQMSETARAMCAPDSPDGGCKVPPGTVFVMGDNRTDSSDSRAHGPIKESSIVGRVFLRIWPLDRIGTP